MIPLQYSHSTQDGNLLVALQYPYSQQPLSTLIWAFCVPSSAGSYRGASPTQVSHSKSRAAAHRRLATRTLHRVPQLLLLEAVGARVRVKSTRGRVVSRLGLRSVASLPPSMLIRLCTCSSSIVLLSVVLYAVTTSGEVPSDRVWRAVWVVGFLS